MKLTVGGLLLCLKVNSQKSSPEILEMNAKVHALEKRLAKIDAMEKRLSALEQQKGKSLIANKKLSTIRFFLWFNRDFPILVLDLAELDELN